MTIRSNRSKLTAIGILVMLVAVVVLTSSRPVAFASASGPSASFTNAPGEGNCTECHIGSALNSGNGSVSINGLPEFYMPGQQISITVTTSQEDAVVYGFQLTAIDQAGKTVGDFALPDQNPPRMQIIDSIVNGQSRRYVEHTLDGLIGANFGSNSWTFVWTAPPGASGTIVFHAAGNAANGDGSPSGDLIYAATKTIARGAPAVSISGRVLTPGGLGLRNAVVRLTGPNDSVTTSTSSLGFYSFVDVPAGEMYRISVVSRRYRFEFRDITPAADLVEFDFTGLE